MSSSTAKRGRPKGSKDGPQLPGAPPRGRPKKNLPEPSHGEFFLLRALYLPSYCVSDQIPVRN